MENKSILNNRFNLQDIELKIEQVDTNEDFAEIEPECMILADKNETSYLLAATEEGFKVVEEGKQVFSTRKNDPASQAAGLITDVMYLEPTNCYLINLNGSLVRKDIDSNLPYYFADVRLQTMEETPCTSFQYSNLSKRLFVNSEEQGIVVIDASKPTLTVRFNFPEDPWDSVADFVVFGQIENRVLKLTCTGLLALFNLNLEQNKVLSETTHQIELESRRNEMANSVAVCSKGKFACVEIKVHCEEPTSSRLMVFEVGGNSLTPKATLDLHQYGFGCQSALTGLGYFSSNAVFLGLGGLLGEEGQEAHLYEFNLGAAELREVEGKRVPHEETNPQKIQRVGDCFYFTGTGGKVMKVSCNQA